MVQKNRIQKLFMVMMTVILLFSQTGLFGLQAVDAKALENAVIVSAITEDGEEVLNPVAIEISDGDTAFDVLEKADDNLESESYGDMGEFITGINGVKAESDENFWSFYVNGLFQSMGADSTEVSDGDNIQFILTTLGVFPADYDITVSAIDADGENIIEEQTVAMPQNTTAYDALLKAAADQEVDVDVTVDSEYLAFLNGLGEPLERECEFWSTSMNGELMQVGLLQHTIQDGDVLELFVDDWCEPEEPIEEDEDETNKPPADEDTDEENNEQATNDEEAMQAIIDYIVANPEEMDWYGFSALHSAGADISTTMADDVASSITDDYSGSATDIAKDIIILTSAGHDATDVNGVNLVDLLIEQNMATSNQLVYSLLAINSGDYEIPEADRTRIIDAILEEEIEAGGWSFFGPTPSPDITGIALIALSPYKEQAEVNDAIDRAIRALSEEQGEEGGYDISFNGGYSAESAALAIVGLAAVGVDVTSEDFTKSGGNLLEHLLDYQMDDGSFKHLISDENASAFATNQGALALIAYDKFKNGTGTVFHFVTSEEPEEEPEKPEEEPEEEPEEKPEEEQEQGKEEEETGKDEGTDEEEENEELVIGNEQTDDKTGPSTTSKDATDVEGEALPKTATDMFNMLALGFLVLLAGATLLYIKSRKEKIAE